MDVKIEPSWKERLQEEFGGIDKCFVAEPIPDGVWARMQGKT